MDAQDATSADGEAPLRSRTGDSDFVELFDEDDYLAANPDVRAAVRSGQLASGLEHYQSSGRSEGRRLHPPPPEPFSDDFGGVFSLDHPFDEAGYLRANPDVRDAVASGLLLSGREHYLLTGRSEGRPAYLLPLPLPPYRPRPVDPDAIAFPHHEAPKVSIVVPVHNHLATTLTCLDSLSRASIETSFEVIVADDASTDATATAMRRIVNLRLLEQERNLGFLRTCNAASHLTRGEYLLLLNNDTEVAPCAIDALVATLDRDPTVGVVAARLLYGNNTLQEAGAIIWRDGEATNYGRGGHPSDFRYMTRRDVDYCSGAALMIRRDLWNEIGGFDDRFAPAYYEDADLCFAVRAQGYRVVVEPTADVIHHEGVSHGTDVKGPGVKESQRRNRRKFVQKWRRELQTHYPKHTDFELVARDHRRTCHVVVFDNEVPTPDHDAGSARMDFILEALTQLGFVVHFIPSNMRRVEPYTGQLQARGIEVVYGGFDPTEFVISHSDTLSFILISRPSVAQRFLPALRERLPHVPLVYDMVDSHARREHRRADLERSDAVRASASDYEQLEAELANECDAVVAVSDEDASFLKASADPDIDVFILPTIHKRQAKVRAYSERSGILFIGGYAHPPNVDAAVVLAREIFPRVHEHLPDARLVLAGSRPTPEVEALAGGLVTVLGWVPDVGPLFDSARVFAAPLRYGAGVKGKIGDSLSWGLPVVTTSIGAEGFAAADGAHVLIAETFDEFAARIVSLYEDEPTWSRMSAAGIDLVDARFGPEVGLQRLRKLIEAVSLDPLPS